MVFEEFDAHGSRFLSGNIVSYIVNMNNVTHALPMDDGGYSRLILIASGRLEEDSYLDIAIPFHLLQKRLAKFNRV